jgi:hypothetical protein
MKTCPHCKSTGFDDLTVCYGCLQPFIDDSVEREYLNQNNAPIDVQVVNEAPQHDTATPVSLPVDVSKTTTIQSRVTGRHAGMARLHIRMPEGYHYDVYLDKPEGASIQIGWVPDVSIEQDT